MTDPVFPTGLCPECSGPNIPNHPGGWLYFKHKMTCPLLVLEDTRAFADYQGLGFPPYVPSRAPSVEDNPGRQRPVTLTERTLLAALGYELPDDAVTVVGWLTSGVRRREWPAATEVVQA